MALRQTAVWLIPMFYYCYAAKCSIPFLRDYIEDYGNNECKFINRYCIIEPTIKKNSVLDVKEDDKSFGDLKIFEIICIAIVSFLVPLVFIATASDLIFSYTSRKLKNGMPDFWNGLMVWSFYRNSKSLLNSKGDKFYFLSGIRVFCAYWILLGHVISFPVALDIENGETINIIKELRKSYIWTPIENFTLAVDTFFFISGFLLFHSTWKMLKTNNGKLNIHFVLLHKYWRLIIGTVVFMIHITICYLILRSDSCFFDLILFFRKGCSYPWKNFLFIQNYWPVTEMLLLKVIALKLLWSHEILVNKLMARWLNYVMQTRVSNIYYELLWSPYLVSSYLVPVPHLGSLSGLRDILELFRNQSLGITIGSILVIICNVLTYFILNRHIHKFENVEENERFLLMKLDNCRIIVYNLPFDHFGPYWCGMATGCLINSYYCRIANKAFQQCAWVFSIICLTSVAFSYRLCNSTNVCFLYESLHRTIWGIGLIWIIYACATGNGGILNKFLSWRPFIVLGDICYLFYIGHIPIILKDMCLHKGNYPFQIPYWISRSMRSTVISFIVAFLSHIVIERPVLKWKEAFLFGKE